jgi:hypothetical protein
MSIKDLVLDAMSYIPAQTKFTIAEVTQFINEDRHIDNIIPQDQIGRAMRDLLAAKKLPARKLLNGVYIAKGRRTK